MSLPENKMVYSMSASRLWLVAVCCVLGLSSAASMCGGQVIESAPPRQAPEANPFAPPQNPKAPATNGPIIQSLPQPKNDTPAAPAKTADAANTEPAPLFSDSLTMETVQLRLKDATDDQSLDKAAKDELTGLYQQSQADLKDAATQEATAADFAQKMQSLPAQIEKAKKTKQDLSKPVQVKIPHDATLVQLQQELNTREESLANAKKKLDDAVNSLKDVTTNRGDSSQTRKSSQDFLAQSEQQLKALPTGNTVTRQTLAKRTRLRAQWQLLRARLAMLDKKDAYRQASSTELLPLERDIAALEAGRLETEVQAWQKAVTAERQQESDRQKAQAEAQVRQALTFQKYPSLAEHANKIVKLAELRQTTAARIPVVVKQLDRETSELKTLQDNFKQSRERVAAAASTMNVGTLLRLQQKKLPNVRELERNIHARQDEIQQFTLSSYEASDRTKELADSSKATEDLLDSLHPRPQGKERAELKVFVGKLLETEKSHLDNLNSDYNALLDKLYPLDKVEKQLIEETESYSRFISENVLWIRSTDPLWKHTLQDFQDAGAWLLRPEGWAAVLSALGGDFWEHPGLWVLALAAFGILLIQQRKMKHRIDEIGKTLNKRAVTEFRPTFRVLRDTVLVAISWPGLLCWVGYRLSRQLDESASVSAVGSALFAMGLVYFPVELLKQACRTNGLVQSHFTWPAPVVTMIRRNLRWFKIIVPPLWLVTALFASAGSLAAGSPESLGRACFVLALILEALFMHRVLRPSGAAFRALIAQKQGGWIDRLKYVFYAAGVLVPLALAGLAIVGYYYTAQQLIMRFYATALLALLVLIIDALIQRWLLITRRRLAMEQLRQRREAAIAQAQAQQAAAGASGQPAAPPAISDPVDERLDVASMNDQTRQLIRSLLFVGITLGLWGVWVDVLPALAVLKNVKIQALTIDRVVEEPVKPVADTPAPDGNTPAPAAGKTAPEKAPETVQKTIKVPITLADLILSVLILIVAIMAARNLPGMLEMIVLQRLPIDNAARYAVTTLAQYVFTIVGVSTAFYVVGLRWQNVQWLAAALMVGLGFGLQEIFANFFSGLIVLLERPVRVGDIVTLGNTTGIVSKIRMRATTITNWERQEMIIPNKDLITGTVLNWTLTDTIQRVFIQVGIAYGSDTDLATQLLYKVMKSHPQVMADPAPVVTFAGFGDSTLNFELRCYLPTASIKLATIHELNLAIDNTFREAGIEIAFPQCDLHIRSVEAAFPVQQITHSTGNNKSGNRPQENTALSKRA